MSDERDYTLDGWTPPDTSGQWCAFCGVPDGAERDVDWWHSGHWRFAGTGRKSWFADTGRPFADEPDDFFRRHAVIVQVGYDGDTIDACTRCCHARHLSEPGAPPAKSLHFCCDWCDKPGGEVWTSPEGIWALSHLGPWTTRDGDEVDRPEQVTRVRDNRNEIVQRGGETVRLCYQCRHASPPGTPDVDETGQGRLF